MLTRLSRLGCYEDGRGCCHVHNRSQSGVSCEIAIEMFLQLGLFLHLSFRLYATQSTVCLDYVSLSNYPRSLSNKRVSLRVCV